MSFKNMRNVFRFFTCLYKWNYTCYVRAFSGIKDLFPGKERVFLLKYDERFAEK